MFQDAAAGTPSPDRLSGVRDGLLRASPYLAVAGALLMLMLMLLSLQSLFVSIRVTPKRT